MSEQIVRLLKITDPYLKSLGFSLAKSSGQGVSGLKLGLGLGYIEYLSLRQNFQSNNFQFLYPCLKPLQLRPHLSFFCGVLDSIRKGTSNHDDIVRLSRSSTEFRDNAIEFAEHVFDIRGEFSSLYEVLESERFRKALIELNVQIYCFSSDDIVWELKISKFTNPIVVPLLIKLEDMKIFNLYHEKYKEISSDHFNLSLDFGLGKQDFNPVTHLEGILETLLEHLPDSLMHSENSEVFKILNSLEKVNTSQFFKIINK